MTNSFRAGYVGVIGLPNAGKSTLVNALVGEKVSIVTAKPQTTRQRVLGICNTSNEQMIFVDAPGVIHNKKGLNGFLQQEYKEVVDEADVLLLVLNPDAKHFDPLKAVVEIGCESRKPCLAVLTKKDLAFGERALAIGAYLRQRKIPSFEVSALKHADETRKTLLDVLAQHLPEAPAPYFSQDLYTTQNLREMYSEIIREKCFQILHKEIPFGMAVRISKFDESAPVPRIFAEILIDKPNHKKIVVGGGGENLKKIGQRARQEFERTYGKKTFLSLHVVVRQNWTKNKRMMRELGYSVSEAPR